MRPDDDQPASPTRAERPRSRTRVHLAPPQLIPLTPEQEQQAAHALRAILLPYYRDTAPHRPSRRDGLARSLDEHLRDTPPPALGRLGASDRGDAP